MPGSEPVVDPNSCAAPTGTGSPGAAVGRVRASLWVAGALFRLRATPGAPAVAPRHEWSLGFAAKGLPQAPQNRALAPTGRPQPGQVVGDLRARRLAVGAAFILAARRLPSQIPSTTTPLKASPMAAHGALPLSDPVGG